MTIIDKVKSQKKKPYTETDEKGCVKITSQERDNLKIMIKERQDAQNSDYYYFFFFFIMLLIIATIILIAL